MTRVVSGADVPHHQRAVDRWRQAAASLVADAVPGYDIPAQLPLNLNTVAKRLGVADIKYLARDVHGFTDWSTDRPTIYLATSRSDGRRRFTLGHEVGHILLGHDGGNAAYNPLVTPELVNDIELSCDAIAAELVLPFAWLDKFGGYVKDLQSAGFAARKLRISLATLVVRMGHWGARPMLFQLQAAAHDRWVVVNRVGVPHALRGAMKLDPATRTTFHSLGDGDHRLNVTFLDAAANAHELSADVRRVGDVVTVYVANSNT